MSSASRTKSDDSDARDAARQALRDLIAREPYRHPIIVGLVAPIGTPLTPVEKGLRTAFLRYGYQSQVVQLSDLLDDIPYHSWAKLPRRKEKNYYEKRMDAGDQLRVDVGNGAALAAVAIARVSQLRRSGQLRAFLLRSLKHPDEAELLRHVYGDAFSLVAVTCSVEERRDNLAEQLAPFDNPGGQAEGLMARDEFDSNRSQFGQRVRDVYSMADVYLPAGRGLPVGEEVNRFVDSLFGAPFVTPTREEEGMRLAYDAGLRSAAVGRQVGAALVPVMGTPIIVGTNEVPKPGGGQFWSGDIPDYRDFQTGIDPNPAYTRWVVQELLERLGDQKWLVNDLRKLGGPELFERAMAADEEGNALLGGARAAALIEFTRCLHAEQAAIVNAARGGVPTEKASLFTTTFPCHECAKMIVGAGIVDVFYMAPYPKSLVGRLYRDLIDVAPPLSERGLVGGRVPFRPFVGVAPRRYAAAFTAGVRGSGGELTEFEPLNAPPRTNGWSEFTVRERESIAVTAIERLLILRAKADQQHGGTPIEQPTSASSSEPPATAAPSTGQRRQG